MAEGLMAMDAVHRWLAPSLPAADEMRGYGERLTLKSCMSEIWSGHVRE